MSVSFAYIVERFVPSFSFFSITIFCYKYPSFVPEQAKELAGAFSVIFSVFLGFITTSLSIFFSAQDKEFMKSMKTSGAFFSIVSYHHWAIVWCSFAVVLSLIYTVYGGNSSDVGFILHVKYLMLASSVASFVSMLRIGYFYKKIILKC